MTVERAVERLPTVVPVARVSSIEFGWRRASFRRNGRPREEEAYEGRTSGAHASGRAFSYRGIDNGGGQRSA